MVKRRKLIPGKDIGWGKGVLHDVTFNFGFGKACSPAIFEKCFSFDKDIWTTATDCYMYFHIIVLFSLC